MAPCRLGLALAGRNPTSSSKQWGISRSRSAAIDRPIRECGDMCDNGAGSGRMFSSVTPVVFSLSSRVNVIYAGASSRRACSYLALCSSIRQHVRLFECIIDCFQYLQYDILALWEGHENQVNFAMGWTRALNCAKGILLKIGQDFGLKFEDCTKFFFPFVVDNLRSGTGLAESWYMGWSLSDRDVSCVFAFVAVYVAGIFGRVIDGALRKVNISVKHAVHRCVDA